MGTTTPPPPPQLGTSLVAAGGTSSADSAGAAVGTAPWTCEECKVANNPTSYTACGLCNVARSSSDSTAASASAANTTPASVPEVIKGLQVKQRDDSPSKPYLRGQLLGRGGFAGGLEANQSDTMTRAAAAADVATAAITTVKAKAASSSVSSTWSEVVRRRSAHATAMPVSPALTKPASGTTTSPAARAVPVVSAAAAVVPSAQPDLPPVPLLKNHGNTCFGNAVGQIMLASLEVAGTAEIMELRDPTDHEKQLYPYAAAFIHLVKTKDADFSACIIGAAEGMKAAKATAARALATATSRNDAAALVTARRLEFTTERMEKTLVNSDGAQGCAAEFITSLTTQFAALLQMREQGRVDVNEGFIRLSVEDPNGVKVAEACADMQRSVGGPFQRLFSYMEKSVTLWNCTKSDGKMAVHLQTFLLMEIHLGESVQPGEVLRLGDTISNDFGEDNEVEKCLDCDYCEKKVSHCTLTAILLHPYYVF